MANIQKQTEEYISAHPAILDSLKNGLINYSKLARLICKELNIKSFDAVLIACRRSYYKFKKSKAQEQQIVDILKRSRIEVKNKIIVVVLEKQVYYDSVLELGKEIKRKAETFHVIESNNAITLITSEDFLEKINSKFKQRIINLQTNLAEVTLKSPKELETTPGVMGYLFSLLAQNNINIVETMSCWTDTLFVVHDNDIQKIINVLRF